MESQLHGRISRFLLVCGFLIFCLSACQSTRTAPPAQPAGFWDGLVYGLEAPFMAPLVWLKGSSSSFPNLRSSAFAVGIKVGLIWDAIWMLGIIGWFVIDSHVPQDLRRNLAKGDYQEFLWDLFSIWIALSLASIAGSLIGLLLYILLPWILIGVLLSIIDLISKWFKKHFS